MPIPVTLNPFDKDAPFTGGGGIHYRGVGTVTGGYYGLRYNPNSKKYNTYLITTIVDDDGNEHETGGLVGSCAPGEYQGRVIPGVYPSADGDSPVGGDADFYKSLGDGSYANTNGPLSDDQLAALRGPYIAGGSMTKKCGAVQYLRTWGLATTKDGTKFTAWGNTPDMFVGVKAEFGEVNDEKGGTNAKGEPYKVGAVLSLISLPASGSAGAGARTGASAASVSANAAKPATSTPATNGAPSALTALVERAVAQFALDKGGTVEVNPKGVGAVALHVHKTLMGDAATKAHALNGSKMPTAAWLLAGDRPWIADTDANTITVLSLPEAS